MSAEPPEPAPIPSIAGRAGDTAVDVSRTIEEVSDKLKTAVERLGEMLMHAQEPGQPLARLRTVTRKAPPESLLVAFLLGVVVARRG
jgi:hypothetical protein